MHKPSFLCTIFIFYALLVWTFLTICIIHRKAVTLRNFCRLHDVGGFTPDKKRIRFEKIRDNHFHLPLALSAAAIADGRMYGA